MNPHVVYIKDKKTIVDFTLVFPQNLTIYFDLIIENLIKIEKKIDENIKKINKVQKTIFNYVHPDYSLKVDKTNYYTSRAYLDGEIKENQNVYVCCFSDRTEIFPIDWSLITKIHKFKKELKRYTFLNNQSGVYILRLENNKYYIGSSSNIFRRLIQHWSGCGSKWTQLFKPVDVITWILTNDNLLDLENLMTKAYVNKYCALNVRGGNFYI